MLHSSLTVRDLESIPSPIHLLAPYLASAWMYAVHYHSASMNPLTAP
jgi:hypothetical protein